MASISILKGNNKYYSLKDNFAINKIIFNNKQYLPDSNGNVTITNDLEDIYEKDQILQLKIINYGDEIEDTEEEKKRTIYIINEENDNIDSNYSSSSLATFNEEGQLVRLSTPTIKFEEDNINFDYLNGNINISSYKFTSFENFYNFYEAAKKSNLEVTVPNGSTISSYYIYTPIAFSDRNNYIVCLDSSNNMYYLSYNDEDENITFTDTTITIDSIDASINIEKYLNDSLTDEEKSNFNEFARKLFDPRMEV